MKFEYERRASKLFTFTVSDSSNGCMVAEDESKCLNTMYLIREYARIIDSVSAFDAENKPLTCTKHSKNRWKVPATSTNPILMRYRVYFNEFSVRTNFVDSEFAILSGAATFLTSSQHLSDEHTVQLRLPITWKQSVTSVKRKLALSNESAGGPCSLRPIVWAKGVRVEIACKVLSVLLHAKTLLNVCFENAENCFVTLNRHLQSSQ